MVTIRSLIKVANGLVPVEGFAGPIIDEDYIEGAIVLSVDGTPVLTNDMVDYVDQLWAYLIEGLEEIVAGRDFLTCYPDMPIEVAFKPAGGRVDISLKSRKRTTEVNVGIQELCSAMASAGTLFFRKLQPYVSARDLCDQYVARLAALTRDVRDAG